MEKIRSDLQSIEPKSNFVYVEQVGAIDVTIAPLIKILNDLGYITLASCSGIQSEHYKPNVNSGYISFDIDKIGDKLHALISILNNAGIVNFEEGDCYFRNSITVRIDAENEKKMMIIWGNLTRLVLIGQSGLDIDKYVDFYDNKL